MSSVIIRGPCSNCEKVTDLEVISREERIKVREDFVKTQLQYSRCTKCGDEFLDGSQSPDPLDLAYRVYRKNHRLLQPEEIKQWRKRYKLSQTQLARLLSLGTATISRYENGSLQDASHDKLLRLAMYSENLYKLIEDSKGIFTESRKEELREHMEGLVVAQPSFDDFILAVIANYEPSEFSGYKRLDLTKFYNVILLLCKEGVFKTKLNKLLFYTDFKHYREYAGSLTGAVYAHIPFGPAPDNYEIYYASLKFHKAIEFIEETYPEYTGEKIRATKEPDLSMFSSSELDTIASVKQRFAHFSAKEIADFSHGEVGYQETSDGQIISYSYATQLKY